MKLLLGCPAILVFSTFSLEMAASENSTSSFCRDREKFMTIVNLFFPLEPRDLLDLIQGLIPS